MNSQGLSSKSELGWLQIHKNFINAEKLINLNDEIRQISSIYLILLIMCNYLTSFQ